MTAAERKRRQRLGFATPRGVKKENNMLSVVALPSTRQELVARRVLKKRPTVIDIVEPIVVALWETEEFQKLVDAVEDGAAVEGSLDIDDTLAAEMIRGYAVEHDIKDISGQKLSTLRYALRRVLNRYEVGRVQRAEQSKAPSAGTDKDAAE